MKKLIILCCCTLFFTVFLWQNKVKAQWVSQGIPTTGALVNNVVSIGTTLFCATSGPSFGVYKSINNGITWVAASNGLPTAYVNRIQVLGSALFIGTVNQGVYRSTDQGASWVAVNNGLPVNITGLCFALSGSTLYVGTEGTSSGVFRTTNNGESWTALNTGLGDPEWPPVVRGLAVSGDTLFAGLQHFGVFRSTNGGASWTAVNNGVTDLHVYSVAILPGGNIIAGGLTGGMFRSTNTGASWTEANNGNTSVFIRTLLVIGSDVLAGGNNGGVFYSSDFGLSWTAFNTNLPGGQVMHLTICNSDIYLALYLTNIYRRPLSDLYPPPVTTLNITAIPGGFLNTITGRLNSKDVVKAYLRSTTSPYMIVDSAEAILDSVTFTASFEFADAPTGQYYIVLNHRNSLTTWSKPGGEAFTFGETFNYDFTTAITQAYGSNLVFILGKWCAISGDVNKDGTINASDRGITWNTRNVTGYNPEDVNGDGIVDSQDRGIIWNNSNRNVHSPL